jgi:hypothetical protein
MHYTTTESNSQVPSPASTSKIPSQRDQILRLLRERGPSGVTNVELNGICFRYGARLWELRREGHSIRTENRGSGVFAFVLDAQPGKPSQSNYMRRAHEEAAQAMPLFAGVR